MIVDYPDEVDFDQWVIYNDFSLTQLFDVVIEIKEVFLGAVFQDKMSSSIHYNTAKQTAAFHRLFSFPFFPVRFITTTAIADTIGHGL